MVYEEQVPDFLDWFPVAIGHWLLVVLGLMAVVLMVSFISASIFHGPIEATRKIRSIISEGIRDLMDMSLYRVIALAWLAAKEAVRNRVLVGFCVFLLVLLFAGWFLDPNNDNPGRLYLSVVLTATSYLVLLMVLFLSSFSLPQDIRRRTLHTIVTKPVRSSEIILGRMLGFTLIGTALLTAMGLISYIFVVRGLAHSHRVAIENLQEVGKKTKGKPRSLTGKTGTKQRHRHVVHVDPEGLVKVESNRAHWHELGTLDRDEKSAAKTGSPEGIFEARVPVYGDLRFVDRRGYDTTEGISPGDEWTYRSYIQGDSAAAAVWTFDDINPEMFPEGLPVEMTIGIFRTHKGNIEKGILGSLAVRNPKTGLTVEVEIFHGKEFESNEFFIPRKIVKTSGTRMVIQRIEDESGVKSIPLPEEVDQSLTIKSEFDLFEDLVVDGKTEIWLQCLEGAQYYGCAEPDAYLRAADAPFWLNFAKGYFGIWLQMVLIIGFGVMFSTFLSGSVAMIATAGAMIGGFFNQFMTRLGTGDVLGGGPIEAWIRIVTHRNVISEMDPGISSTVSQMIDVLLAIGLRGMASLLPSFNDFDYSNWVASGFDISMNILMVRSVTAIGFFVPIFVAAYFFLKNREVAR